MIGKIKHGKDFSNDPGYEFIENNTDKLQSSPNDSAKIPISLNAFSRFHLKINSP
jgi:hypothetical protein